MSASFVRALARRVVGMAALWLVVAGTESKNWPLAGLVIALAAFASMRTVPPSTPFPNLFGMLRFLPFFVAQSVRGGVDVASRALRHRPGLRPGTVPYVTRLPYGPSRSFFVAVIGLLPGTLTARLSEDRAEIHVLDLGRDPIPQLRALEDRVADLFGPTASPAE